MNLLFQCYEKTSVEDPVVIYEHNNVLLQRIKYCICALVKFIFSNLRVINVAVPKAMLNVRRSYNRQLVSSLG